MEANHGAVLDPDVFESGELRVELAPGLVGELGRAYSKHRFRNFESSGVKRR